MTPLQINKDASPRFRSVQFSKPHIFVEMFRRNLQNSAWKRHVCAHQMGTWARFPPLSRVRGRNAGSFPEQRLVIEPNGQAQAVCVTTHKGCWVKMWKSLICRWSRPSEHLSRLTVKSNRHPNFASFSESCH